MKEPDMNLWDCALLEAGTLAKYKQNWDGCDSDAVTLYMSMCVLGWLLTLRFNNFLPPDCVYPLADGTVLIEWRYARDHAVSANVRSVHRIDIQTNRGGEYTTRTISPDSDCREYETILLKDVASQE